MTVEVVSVSPMSVEVTLGEIVVDSSVVDHGAKHLSTGTDPIPYPAAGVALVEAATASAQRMALGLGTAALAGDASEGAKGVVQLASIGVPSATKVPKALGADLVALITAAGYSLSPATGDANLDNIADGATYKRILAAVATALNAGTYDAALVSAFGIGAKAKLLSGATSLDSVLGGGIYETTSALDHEPWPGSVAWVLPVQEQSGTYNAQLAIKLTAGASCPIRVRSCGAGMAWGAWRDVWTLDSDGNGGQPPAPKPKPASSNAIGEMYAFETADNAATVLPNGGKWAYIIFTRYTSTAVIYNLDGAAGVAGGTQIRGGQGAGYVNRAVIWRTE